MSLGIKPSTSRERQQLFLETLLNTTDLVSKVSDTSVLAGIAGGIAKISGKAEKDIIVGLSRLFPDLAFGVHLDQVAVNNGIAARFGVMNSSVYVRLVGSPGTTYNAASNLFYATNGVRFQLTANVTIPSFGFTYAKVNSIETGERANVDPLTISRVSPQPSGHIAVLNEVKAWGGRDQEDDNIFRQRIKDGPNILAKDTIAMLEQVFIKINSKVLRVFFQGSDLNGKLVLSIATQNGVDLTQTELDYLLFKSSNFFALTEYKPFGTELYGLKLQNAQYQPIDVSFRVDIDTSFNPDLVRIAIQTAMMKYMDYRFWNSRSEKVEWDNLLQIVKLTRGVKYVPDQYFYPSQDISVGVTKLPRLRGFVMMDLDGTVISSFSGTLLPTYYPNNPDFSYQQTVLDSI